MKYIDVSQWQGQIDWGKAREHVDGVIIRAGYGQGNMDPKFDQNAAECNRLGIPCGAYWFSYARTPEMAKAEAMYLLQAVKPYKMHLPLCFDFEYDSVSNAAARGVNITKDLATAIVFAFCETIEQGNYWCLNYANPDFLKRYFTDAVTERFGLWLAQWPGGTPDLAQPPQPCAVWQWTSAGSVPGISGNVDTNESYQDFAQIIADLGLNNLQPTITESEEAHNWCVSKGIIDSSMRNTEQMELMIWRYHKYQQSNK